MTNERVSARPFVGVGVSTTRCRGGFPRPPANFAVILPLRRALCACHPLTAAVSLCRFATSPSHGEGVDPLRGRGYGATTRRPVCRGRRPRRPATNYIFLAVYARNAFYRVGRGDSPVRGNVCEADKRVPEFGEFCSRRRICSEFRNGH